MQTIYYYLRITLFFNLFIFISYSPYIHASSSTETDLSAKSESFSIVKAVSMALSLSPDIQLKNQDIVFNKGSLQQTQGKFDPLLNLKGSYSDSTKQIAENTDQQVQSYSYSFQASKKLRSGLSLGSSVDLSQDRTDYSSSNLNSKSTQNKAGVYFTVAIPLLKGRGMEVTTARERVAQVNLNIAKLQAKHTITQIVQNTAKAYWLYRSSLIQLNQQQQAEKRAKESLKITQALIDADQVSASLLENAKSKLRLALAPGIFSNKGVKIFATLAPESQPKYPALRFKSNLGKRLFSASFIKILLYFIY